MKITGADENSVNAAKRCLESLSKMYFKGDPINDQNVRYVISLVNDGTESQADTISSDCVCVSYAGKPDTPQDPRSEEILRDDTQEHHHLRSRPRRHRQDLPRGSPSQ